MQKSCPAPQTNEKACSYVSETRICSRLSLSLWAALEVLTKLVVGFISIMKVLGYRFVKSVFSLDSPVREGKSQQAVCQNKDPLQLGGDIFRNLSNSH